MPESPEVQALAEFLDSRTRGHRIVTVDLHEYAALKTRQRPLAELSGATITGIHRFGKHLDIATEKAHLVVSLGRAGWARWNGDAAPDRPPVLVRIELDDALLELTDAGQWLSLGLFLVDDPAEVPAIAKRGPDPATRGFTREQFDRAVGRRRKQLKALLQEQETFAGIGNAYSDEVLHAARLLPFRKRSTLADEEVDALYEATRSTLTNAIELLRARVPPTFEKQVRDFLAVHNKGGQACPRCGTRITEVKAGGFITSYCRGCQR